MRRVLIAGIGGSGKTTLASRLAPVLGLTYHHLDGLYLGPDLRMSPTFVSDIEGVVAGDEWLFDSQGPPASSEAPPEITDLLWSRADTLIWLDYPRHVVLRRAIKRSVRRVITREELWHGRRETPLWWLRPDHPIRRAWRLTQVRHDQLTARTQDPLWAHLTVIQLQSPRETVTWLGRIESDYQAR